MRRTITALLRPNLKKKGMGMQSCGYGSRLFLVRLLATAALGYAGLGPAQAQSTDSAASAADVLPGDILVTARKREETLQSVPDAISALGAQTIERAGVRSLQDVAQLTPNLVIIDQLRPGIQTVSIRGFTTVQGGKAPFATIIDGVQQPGMEYLAQNLVDIERIEVVRGPQGTLYGGGAIAGAINIVTKKPGDTFESALKAGYFEGPGWNASATVSAPIIKDTLSFRASIYHVDDDGQIENQATGNAVDQRKDTEVRARLLFTPSPDVTVDINGSHTHGRDGALWLVPVDNDDFENYSAKPSTDIDGIDKRNLYSLSGKVDVDLGPATLTSITAYNKAKQSLFADGDFSAAPLFAQTWDTNSRSWSEEVRMASNGDGPLQYVVGFFYQDYKVADITQFGSLQEDGSVDYFSLTANTYRSKSWAVFGQASYDLTDALQLTLGLRYDRDRQSAEDDADPTIPRDRKTFHRWQPKINLSYKITPDVLAYASYATGFRTGGFNPSSPLALRIYNNEVSENYEAGIKASFLGGRLVANGALFHTDFDNQQFFFSRATDEGIFRVIVNIPKTEVNGGELEITGRPTDFLMLRGSLGYNDTSIKRFDATGLYHGNRTPQVYGLTLGGTAEVTAPIADEAKLIARLDVEHRGDVYWDIENEVRSTPKTFLNARLAVEYGNWTLAAYARNLTNERTPAAVGANALGPGRTLRSLNSPRRLGVEASVKF